MSNLHSRSHFRPSAYVAMLPLPSVSRTRSCASLRYPRATTVTAIVMLTACLYHVAHRPTYKSVTAPGLERLVEAVGFPPLDSDTVRGAESAALDLVAPGSGAGDDGVDGAAERLQDEGVREAGVGEDATRGDGVDVAGRMKEGEGDALAGGEGGDEISVTEKMEKDPERQAAGDAMDAVEKNEAMEDESWGDSVDVAAKQDKGLGVEDGALGVAEKQDKDLKAADEALNAAEKQEEDFRTEREAMPVAEKQEEDGSAGEALDSAEKQEREVALSTEALDAAEKQGEGMSAASEDLDAAEKQDDMAVSEGNALDPAEKQDEADIEGGVLGTVEKQEEAAAEGETLDSTDKQEDDAAVEGLEAAEKQANGAVGEDAFLDGLDKQEEQETGDAGVEIENMGMAPAEKQTEDSLNARTEADGGDHVESVEKQEVEEGGEALGEGPGEGLIDDAEKVADDSGVNEDLANDADRVDESLSGEGIMDSVDRSEDEHAETEDVQASDKQEEISANSDEETPEILRKQDGAAISLPEGATHEVTERDVANDAQNEIGTIDHVEDPEDSEVHQAPSLVGGDYNFPH